MTLKRTALQAALAIVVCLLGASVQAACPLQNVTLDGSVVSGNDGSAIAQASVEAFWEERAAGQMSVARESEVDGTYSLRVSFDTYSGRTFIGRDLCDAVLESVRLIASKEGFAPAERELDATQFELPQRFELKPAR